MVFRAHLAGLDLVRFFAASSVMFFHFATNVNFATGLPRYPELSLLSAGWVGVEIFFVLSGFVIALSANGISGDQFLKGRIGRLMPAIWICATLCFAATTWLAPAHPEATWGNYLRTVIIYPLGPWIDGVYWTLTIETFFYAAVCVLLFCNAFHHIEKFAIVLGLASSTYLFGRTFLDWPKVPQHLLLQHGCFFAFGIMLWVCFNARGLSPLRLIFLGVFLAACLLEIMFVAHGWSAKWQPVLASGIWLLLMLAIGISILSATPGNGWTRTIGLTTYPLYLLHTAVGNIVLPIDAWIGRDLAFVTAVMISTGLSWAVVKIEAPIRDCTNAAFDLRGWR